MNEQQRRMLKPTLDQVVAMQEEAVCEEFSLQEEIEEDGESSWTKEEFKEVQQRLLDLKAVYETPINLTDCILTQTGGTRIRLTSDAKAEITRCFTKDYFSEHTLRYNSFYFIAEVSQAGGHIIVLDEASGKTYPMLRAGLFEVIPPQEC